MKLAKEDMMGRLTSSLRLCIPRAIRLVCALVSGHLRYASGKERWEDMERVLRWMLNISVQGALVWVWRHVNKI